MAGPDFPSYACILMEGYSEQPDYNGLRTDMDGGIAKQRPRRTRPLLTRAASVGVRSVEDKVLFDSWFRNSIAGGFSWFTFTDPVDGIVKQGRFVGGELAWTTPGIVWRAQVQIESLEA